VDSILFEDEYIIAVNKPAGIFVHPTNLDATAGPSMMDVLRDYCGHYVYAAHRLDRKTTGVLLFAKNREVHSLLNKAFEERTVQKNYLAIVRGFVDDEIVIDYPLVNTKGKMQEAVTGLNCLERAEIDLPHGLFRTSRYSLVSLTPVTGRTHQLRRHMAHIRHPIIGDRPFGCNKQNRLLLEKFGLQELMLHALSLSFQHPVSGHNTQLIAPIQSEFKRMAVSLGLPSDRISHA
jgi:tRNA pseudouridine65 synthase